MQGTILDAVRRRFVRRMDQDQLAGLLAVQAVREYFDESSIEGSLRHGILKIKTDRHDIIMQLFVQREPITKLIYQKWGQYGLPATPIKHIKGT